MAPSLIVEPIALEVLRLQVQHVTHQAESIKAAVEKHGAGVHLGVAAAYLESIEHLLRGARACLTCEMNDRAKLAQHLTQPAAVAADPRS